ncbi:hypothetical protein [Planctomyces sp. SH-PL14]|uniref:hypothetical protein n=1 Tax=Planctomyces sp. SH-PL14 TaxID=1632864 RepID=UPI00078DFC78|nr:hypothetical protein [Planctomyces sp. SH-PL14]AMV22558.1 hypothetical protein VT03_31975 [Planctomyces sp. SH-PL14]
MTTPSHNVGSTDLSSLKAELEAAIPDDWNQARLQVVMHYEEGSVGTSHLLSPPDDPDGFIDIPGDVFHITTRIERTARAAGQPWREMTVDALRSPAGWEFAVRFVNKAA